jgi:D-galacturonate reductase
VSFEAFIDAVAQINAGQAQPSDFDHALATIGTTVLTTAVLEAGRRSLDLGGRPIDILYQDAADPHLPSDLQPAF